MDGNKDEALKCLRIGKEALDSGDRARALKFLTKARRLDPSLPVDDLISSAGDESPPEPPPPSTPDRAEPPPPDKPSALNSPRLRTPAKGPSASASSSSSAAYTEEQISIVRQIKREKDYYAILGLDKGCLVEDVRKAYRKISLKVHPDKNNAPGAEDAFKAVSRAFQCLSNEESRQQYDLVGSEEEFVQRRRSTHAAHRGFNGFYEDEFDPDEIFRSFFFGGGGMPPATTFQGFRFGTNMGPSAARHGQGQGHGSGNLRTLIQLLPVIFILLMNFLPSSDPIYSLSRTYPYQHQVVTAKGVPFYVKSSKFEEEYPLDSSERLSIERQVERDYVGFLSQNCRVELQRRHWGLTQQTPHCDMLEQFSGVD